MKRPHPRDFEFDNEEEVKDTLAQAEARDEKALTFAAVATAGSLVAYCFFSSTWALLWLLLLFPLLPLPLFGLGAIAWRVLAPIPKVRAAKNFKKAHDAYQQWWARTQEVFWRALTGREFEHEVARLFEVCGYKVRLTPASGDKGVDLFIERNGTTTAVQCKAHKKPIGPAVARELYGAMMAHGIQSGMLVTLEGGTKGTRELSEKTGIEILNIHQLISMQRQIES